MDKAKAAVSDFMSKSGKHDTTVHENVAPAVTRETVQPHLHEKHTTAIDKERHQDHYHTSVQPVQDKEILPEQHHHNLAGVEHRQYKHGNDRDVAARLEQEAAQFKNESVAAPARESHATAPTISGEHIHHHVHETIQPVVNKETIQPHVVHTTQPIHEVHHNAAQHHATSALPAVSMADFKKQGGTLGGRDERYDAFEGEPRSVGSALGGHGSSGNHTSSNPGGHHGSSRDYNSGNSVGHGGPVAGSTGSYDTSRDPKFAPAGGVGGAVRGGHAGHDVGKTSSNGSSHSKPSLMDKLNPRVDADGDGKVGFMK